MTQEFVFQTELLFILSALSDSDMLCKDGRHDLEFDLDALKLVDPDLWRCLSDLIPCK